MKFTHPTVLLHDRNSRYASGFDDDDIIIIIIIIIINLEILPMQRCVLNLNKRKINTT